jgi:hypothetical protein
VDRTHAINAGWGVIFILKKACPFLMTYPDILLLRAKEYRIPQGLKPFVQKSQCIAEPGYELHGAAHP